MNRILSLAAAAMLCLSASAQPRGMQPRSTYEMVDEMRKELNLDHDQFEKVYSAYDKYNKTVFGDVEKKGDRPTPPPGAPRPGNGGGPDFRGGRPDRHQGFDPQHAGRPGGDRTNAGTRAQPDLAKMEKQRAKAEEKLCKSMKKIFKKDPETYSRWQAIRERQLREMPPMPPAPGTK